MWRDNLSIGKKFMLATVVVSLTTAVLSYAIIDEFVHAAVTLAVAASTLAVTLAVLRYGLVSRLRKIEEVSDRRAAGDIKARIPPLGNDELGKLGVTYNRMADETQKLYRTLERRVGDKTSELAKKVRELEAERARSQKALADLKLANASLRQSDARYAALLEGIGDALLAFDDSGKVRFVNKAAIAMFGWSSPKEALGRTCKDVLGLERPAGVALPEKECPVARCLASGRRVVIAATDGLSAVGKGTGTFPVSMIVAPIRDGGRAVGAVLTLRDVTEQVEMDRMKTDFVTIVSHQLRTPLSVVSWYTEMLMAGEVGKLNRKQNEYLREVYVGNKRMIDLVNSLLSVSRIDLGKLVVASRPISLQHVVDAALEEATAEAAKKRIKIYRQYDRIPDTPLDPGLVRLVMNNLIANAVTYTPAGGSVSVKLRRQDGHALVTVADTGIGIPEADRRKIFTKFFRADNVKASNPAGSGLGLYIAKALTVRMGGKIWFESKEGEGTEFFVSFPIASRRVEGGDGRVITA